MSVTSTQSGLQSIRQIWALAGEHRAALTYSIGYRFAQSLALGMAYAAMLWMIVGLVNGRAMTFGWAAQITGLMAMSFVLQLLLSFLSVRLAWTASYDGVAGSGLVVFVAGLVLFFFPFFCGGGGARASFGVSPIAA